MIAQRKVEHDFQKQDMRAQRKAMLTLLNAPEAEQTGVQQWACEVCGMVHTERRVSVCESCGATGTLSPYASHIEIPLRWA